MRTLFIVTLISIFTSGCANIHTEQHFETDQSKIEAAKTLSEADSNVSTLYIFRERAWLQSIAYTPLPAEYISVNGTMVAIMPIGSYLALTLVPGRAEVSRLIVYGTKVVEEKMEIHSQPGKKIFAGSRFFGFTTPFVQVDAKTGERIIENAQLAKIIYKPVSKAEFIHRVGAVDEGKSRPHSSSPIQNFLPTEQQVTATLEVLASIAMFVVLVAGVAIAAKGIALPVESPPPQNLTSPPTYTQPVPFQKTTSLQLNSGSLAELIQPD